MRLSAALYPVSYALVCGLTTFAAILEPRDQRCVDYPNYSAVNPKCCVWKRAYDVLQNELFNSGDCEESSHDALRLAFHDAIGWSPTRGGGGADGSLMKYSFIELGYPPNNGLGSIVFDMQPIADRFAVSYDDFIQFAGAVAVRNCQGGPHIEFFAGRPHATQIAPDGLIPLATESVTGILERMADAGFSADELVDLLAAHSIGFQEEIDSTINFTPFDSTVKIFDGQFFLDTLFNGTIDMGQQGLAPGEALSPRLGEFRLESDRAIARDPRTACRWQSYILDSQSMRDNFKAALAKVAVIGQDKSSLWDCTEAIPPPVNLNVPAPTFPPGLTHANVEWSCPGAPPLRAGVDVARKSGQPTEIPRAFGH